METSSSLRSPGPLSTNKSREFAEFRPLIELGGAYALILITIWTPRPIQRWWYLAALLWVLLCAWRSFPGRKALGLQCNGLVPSLWVPFVALFALVAASSVAKSSGNLHAPHGFAGWVDAFAGYAVWAAVQQFLLVGFFFLRLERLLPGKFLPVIAATSLFALAHLPNPILTPITFVWGLCACLVFQRHRNLLPLAIAHALLGIGVSITVPPAAVHNMRVGLGYLRYQPPHAAPAITPPKLF